MISVRDVISIILACCGGIITIGGAISVIIGWLSKVRAPENRQNEQIAGLLCRVEKLEAKDSEKERRVQNLEEMTEIMLKIQFALLNHAINGNATEELKAVQKEVQAYLSKTKI